MLREEHGAILKNGREANETKKGREGERIGRLEGEREAGRRVRGKRTKIESKKGRKREEEKQVEEK